MGSGGDAAARLTALAAAWGVRVRHTRETSSSLIAHGSWRGQRVVLKVVRAAGDEWAAGAIAAAFDGHGMVRVLAQEPGAALLEELRPATPLLDLVRRGDDDRATDILAGVALRMLEASPATARATTAHAWARAFDHHATSGDASIPAALLNDARAAFRRLCETQRDPRLLHGDLHHANILFDADRGWLAIDPKGVVAELELELAAALRNPARAPETWASRDAVERRLDRLVRSLDVDRARVIGWTFAGAVLSAIWSIQDGEGLLPDDPRLRLAGELRPLL